jgi:hypothetical protein
MCQTCSAEAGIDLQKIEDRRFVRGETVELDGSVFVNCVFDGCEIVYAGGETSWRDVTWLDCKLTFVGSANATIQVLKAVGCVLSEPGGHEARFSSFLPRAEC